MLRNTARRVPLRASIGPRWSYSFRVGKVSEFPSSSLKDPLTRICPSVPPLSPTTAREKSPRAPAYSAARPAGVASPAGSMMSGLSTSRISPGEQAATASIPASAIPNRLARLMVVKLRSESEVGAQEEGPDLRLGQEVLHPESVKGGLSRSVHLGVHAGVPGPGGQVATAQSQRSVLGSEHSGNPGRQAVGERQFAQLQELAVLEVTPVALPGMKPPGHRPRLDVERRIGVMDTLAVVAGGGAAEHLGQVVLLVAALVVEQPLDPERAL